MSKTTFVNGNPSIGVEGTIVTASFLNAVNNHRHMGSATDGDGAIDYAADTGAANAYAIALSPVLANHVIGMPIVFKAANANSGASTLAVNSLPGVAIKKFVNAALDAGDISAGQLVIVVYDGTYYQLINNGQSGYSKTASGYQKFASGIIIQWGEALATAADCTVTWPIEFPNECLQAFATDRTTESPFVCITAQYVLGSSAKTTCVFHAAENPRLFGYFAIGY